MPLIIVLYAWMRERLHARLVGDLASSYLLSLARVAAAAVIVGLLYRRSGPAYVAIFVLARATMTLLTYAYAGLSPAVQRMLSGIGRPQITPARAEPEPSETVDPSASPPLTVEESAQSDWAIYRNAALATTLISLAATIPLELYGRYFHALHETAAPSVFNAHFFVSMFGLGMILRMLGEPIGAVAQSRGRLAMDNWVQIIGEVALVVWIASITPTAPRWFLKDVGVAFALSGLIVVLGRWCVARAAIGRLAIGSTEWFDGSLLASIFIAAFTLSIGHLADFLYGPANILIINRLLSPTLVAEYAPALQIDGALLLTVAAIATVLLPRVVKAAREGDLARLRTLYLRASIAAAGILIVAALMVVVLRDLILQHWLGTVPEATRTILPLVLIHTVIGGTAGIGRAVLLGMGRFRAYTISALLGGIANVSLALIFVHLGFGLSGIAFATILAAAARCAIWMPWYIARITAVPARV